MRSITALLCIGSLLLAAGGCGSSDQSEPAGSGGQEPTESFSSAEAAGTATLDPQGVQALNQIQRQLLTAKGVPPNQLDALDAAKRNTEEMLRQLEQTGEISVTDMLRLQQQMTLMSQYMEAASNALSAMHQAMMSMARATKGQ